MNTNGKIANTLQNRLILRLAREGLVLTDFQLAVILDEIEDWITDESPTQLPEQVAVYLPLQNLFLQKEEEWHINLANKVVNEDRKWVSI